MNPSITPALQCNALYAKSQTYIQRGLRAQAANETEEYQLWASLALELLGKAALAKVHPSLIADPQHYQSLFAACGRQIIADIRTITAKTLFERLSHIEKTFDSRHQIFCEQMALRRNAELHSGESPYTGMLADSWEREFWGAIDILLSMQNETLEQWLGTENSKAPAKIIEQAEEALLWTVKHRITRCKEDFENTYPNQKKRKKIIEESNKLTADDNDWDCELRVTCPACAASGFSMGVLWDETIIEPNASNTDWSSYDPPEWRHLSNETVEKRFIVEKFNCEVCGLHFHGIQEIVYANLEVEFTTQEVREREFKEEYGND